MRNFIWLAVLTACLVCNTTQAQNSKVSSGTNIKKGKLKNGLTYYLYNNMASRGKVNLYLVQNVGAILEEDKQNGLAHFLEHMCFKGTKNFPDRSVLDKFEKAGLRHTINAYTGVEETVYHLTEVPTKDPGFVDQCLILLHDWCYNLTLTDQAIETERPVIIEEMRTRRDLRQRLVEQIYPYTHNKSKYCDRHIAGTPEIIANFDRQTLVDFYEKWYRTDLQAIVVVGDINVFEIETKIKNLFGQIPAKKNPTPRPEFHIADNDSTYYALVKDAENTSGSIAINVRYEKPIHKSSQEFYNETTKKKLVEAMMARRIKKLVKDYPEYINYCKISHTAFPKLYENYEFNVGHKANEAMKAWELVTGMHNDVLINGFTQEELNFVIDSFDKYFKMNKKQFAYQPNQILFGKIKDNFINNLDINNPNEDYKYWRKAIKNLTTDAIKQWHNKIYKGKNRTIIVKDNNQDQKHLTKQEVLTIEKESKPFIVTPEKEEDEESVDLKVINKELIPSKVSKSTQIGLFHTEKWILKNGATVYFKENVEAGGQIDIVGISEGGNSVLKGQDLLHSSLFNMFQTCFTLGDYSREDLDKIFVSEKMNLQTYITEGHENFALSGRYSNVENLFKMLNASFENPGFDEEEYDKQFKRFAERVKGDNTNYKINLQDSINLFKIGAERYTTVNETNLNSISFDGLKKVYKDRYADASNWIFYVVGSISRSKAKKLTETYIGSIQSTERNETIADNKDMFPRAYTKKIVKLDMVDKKAGNEMFLRISGELDRRDQLVINILVEYLREKAGKLLRENLNGTYGVNVAKTVTENYHPSTEVKIDYECDPGRIDELNSALKMLLKAIAEKGMHVNDFNKEMKHFNDYVKKNSDYLTDPNLNWEIGRNNGFFIQNINSFVIKGIDSSSPVYTLDAIKKIDLNYVNEFAKKLIIDSDILDVIFIPKQ